ncbi:hypothetical protein [Streptomyces sp. NPDC055243]|uniref:hypothetical protein n=1 Tax=Streptomyces sp. NPDC055243 TaxID=3365720 RepID=UPI0037D419CF
MTARHYMKAGSIGQDDLIADIQADIASAHGAANGLAAAASPTTEAMRDATDSYLDELAAAKAGTWKPNHPV